MPVDRSADLMKALMAKLYATVTGNDPSIKLPRSKFVSWCSPGIPFMNEDFNFCAKGTVGATAEETGLLQHQGWTLSKIFDYVPEVGEGKGFIDKSMQQTMWASTQDTISKVYGDVLRFSKVLNNELTDDEKARLKKFRDLLVVTEPNILGEMKTKPSPMVDAYFTMMNDYLDAADEYSNLIIDAQSAKGQDPEAIRRVQAFAQKNKFLKKKLEAAEGKWISQGYKNEYEQIVAYIAQVTEKSLVLYKEDLKQKYAASLQTSTNEGSAGDYYYTTLLPGNFAQSTGWTKFSFYAGDYETHYDKATNKWSVNGGVNFGLFSVKAEAGGSHTEENSSKAQKDFTASLEFTQIPIVRPWFDPGFFSMRAWTLDDAWKLNFDKEISDGADVPVGRLVAYPVTALFVRNLRFKVDDSDEQTKFVESSIKAGGSVGYGCFNLGGSYEHGSVKKDFKSHKEGGELVVEGIQMVGTINNIIPKAPNTNPAIKPEQFVGGASVVVEPQERLQG
jgi:hypothetical protein